MSQVYLVWFVWLLLVHALSLLILWTAKVFLSGSHARICEIHRTHFIRRILIYSKASFCRLSFLFLVRFQAPFVLILLVGQLLLILIRKHTLRSTRCSLYLLFLDNDWLLVRNNHILVPIKIWNLTYCFRVEHFRFLFHFCSLSRWILVCFFFQILIHTWFEQIPRSPLIIWKLV